MRILFALIVVTMVVAAIEPARVFTCSCAAPPPPKQAMEKSTAVFLAKVVKIEDDKAPASTRKVTLQVERWWKGGDAKTITVSTQQSGATCGFGFQPDTKYLVYAHAEKGQKMLTVSLCSRTRTAAQAEQSGDAKELGDGKAPAK